MESFGDAPRRVDIGFAGGGTVSARLRQDAYDALRQALSGDRSPRWHELSSDDAEILVDLSQVVFVRLDASERRAGFGGV